MAYRTNRIASSISSGSIINVDPGQNPTFGSPQYIYKGVWGILISEGTLGYVSMSSGGALNLYDLKPGIPFACAPSVISCSNGTVYLLA